ncbi:MAG: VWA domain-containing protein [Candidatus Limnocylindria bacterium]
MSRPLRALLSLTLALAVAGIFPGAAAADDPFRMEITQVDPADFPNVRVVASLMDGQGRPVSGIDASSIVVSEDGRPQRASVESATKLAPIALALALDTSGSMAGKPLADAKSAMGTLIESLTAADQAAIITFSSTVSVAQGLTADKNALLASTKAASAVGNTSIFDAVAAAVDVLSGVPAQTRRAIVLLTDGLDTSSRLSLAAAIDRLRGQGYPLYVIGLGNNLDRAVLQVLADGSTGGQAYVAPTSEQLAGVYAGLAQLISAQYAVTYRSNVRAVAEGATISVTVLVVASGSLVASAATTFTVPPGHGVVAAPSASEPVRVQELPQVAIAVPNPGDGPYSPEVVGLLGTASALCLLLWAFTISTTFSLEALERRRVGILTTAVEPADRTRGRSFWRRVVLPLLARLTRPVARIAPNSMADNVRRQLAQAGDPLGMDPAGFLGLRIGLAIVCGAIFAAGAGAAEPSLLLMLLVGLIGLFFGYVVPGILLGRAVSSRKRRILRALPSALDMLALAARAGMTFDGAIAQVVARWDNPLSDGFRILLSEFRMGRDRREALRAVAQRTGVPDVARFTNAVIQADSLGVPVSKVLHDQAIEMRTRRRQRAEEAARKAPVKMLFPMVGLIFPALFVVILGPAVPRFIDLFAQASPTR